MKYRYNVYTGLSKVKTNTKKYVVGGIVTLVTAAGLSIPALAAGNSTSGIDRYLDNPGRQQATEVGAQCGSGAGSGAFGFFGGQDNNLSGGANGQQTGLNNSAVCGNRQGNL